MKTAKKFLIGLIVVIAIGLGIFFMINFVAIGPGCPPIEIRPYWFMNTDNFHETYGMETIYFTKYGDVVDGAPPFFPHLSPYTSSVFHTRESSDDQYLTIVWYFDDEKMFKEKISTLTSLYLEPNGNLSTTNLLLKYKAEESPNTTVIRTTIVNATGFENNITSGYFTTIRYDVGLNEPWYYIVYYGSVKSGNLAEQTPYLKLLMEPFFNPETFDGSTTPLNFSS